MGALIHTDSDEKTTSNHSMSHNDTKISHHPRKDTRNDEITENAILEEYSKETDPESSPKQSQNEAELLKKLDSIKGVMKENMYKTIERGEHIDQLTNCANDLEKQTDLFHKESMAVKKNLRWRNIKKSLILYSLLFVFISLIVGMLYICFRSMYESAMPKTST